MRKFYQIYCDNIYINADDMIKIMYVIKAELSARIVEVTQQPHQMIVRFEPQYDQDPSSKIINEVKIGRNFMQVSSASERDTTNIFNMIEKYVDISTCGVSSEEFPF
jgi:hypothetical protein